MSETSNSDEVKPEAAPEGEAVVEDKAPESEAPASPLSFAETMRGLSASLADKDLEGVPEHLLTDGKFDAEKAMTLLKAAPAGPAPKADEYDLSLPEDFDFKTPDGEIYKIADDDPYAAKLRQIGGEEGISQAAMSKITALYGQMIKDSHGMTAEQIQTRQTDEWKKLDSNIDTAKSRALSTAKALDDLLGGDKARALIEGMDTAAKVEAYEALLERINGEGATTDNKPGEAAPKSMAERMYLSSEG